ncbi:uncharacterized protein isoform X2 [Leptinotarsa decemlineata]|nr:zinc finger protein 62-like isoform X2 [Leptinotarsa decemlineata]
MGLEEYCCVCVKKNSHLKNIKETNGNDLSYQHKLSVCAPDQKWDEDYNICKNCIEKLAFSYEFIQICILSEELRKGQLLMLIEEGDCKKEIEDMKSFYECDICKKQFKLKRSLKSHITRIHKKQSDDESNEDSKIDKMLLYVQDLKSEKMDTKEDSTEDFIDRDENYSSEDEVKPMLETKKKVNKRKNPLTCEYCGKVFHRRQHYSAHIRAKHTFEKPYQCDMCDAKYTNSHGLLVHKRNHNNEKPFICSYCGKSFVCSGDLYHHSKIHLNKREYKCNMCEKSFNTASILRTHKICMHTEPNEWKYVCSYCSKRFPINSSLATHRKRHIGIKDCSCHICEKKFFDKSDLMKHLRSHSSERLFKCNICHDKEYKNHHGLRKHMKIIHDIGTMKIIKPEKRFLCPMCPKIFAFNNKLQKHLCTHTGEKPFKCPCCDKKFIDNYYRKIHLKKKHNIESPSEHI